MLCGILFASAAAAQNPVTRDLEVRSLDFTGNRAIDEYTLSISIATSQSSWWRRNASVRWIRIFGEERFFNETEFRRDVLRIQALYRLSGYLEARVDTVVRRSAQEVRIEFRITEGEPVRVASIEIRDAVVSIPERTIIDAIPLQVGDAFSRYLLRASGDTIRTLLQDRGYPFAQVYAGYDEDSVSHAARVSFSVDPGHLARISAVAVTGAGKVDPRVVRRAVGIRAGEPYSRKELYETQSTLYRTDLFSYVNVGLVDSIRTTADDSMVAVQVQVNEGKLHAIRAGVGFGTLDCLRGTSGWTGRNFFGGGRSLDVTGRLSKVGAQNQTFCPLGDEKDSVRRQLNYEASVTLREPFLFSRQTSGTFTLLAERHSEIKAFTRISQGAELGVTQLVGQEIPINFTYSLSIGQTIASPEVFCTFLNVCRLEDTVFSGRRWESTLGAGINLNRANSILDPTRGSLLSLQLRYASPLIGSDRQRQFTKGVFEVAAYHPLSRRTVVAWRVRLGALLPAQVGVGISNQTFVPPDERLYLGGPNTIRGYPQNELGQVIRVITSIDSATNSLVSDTTERTSSTGGDRLALANLELRFPILGRLQGAMFADFGGLFGGQPRAAREVFHLTPGIGIRFATPVGPLRIDVAYNPLDPTPGPRYKVVGGELVLLQADYAPPLPGNWDDHLQFHFSVGQAF